MMMMNDDAVQVV